MTYLRSKLHQYFTFKKYLSLWWTLKVKNSFGFKICEHRLLSTFTSQKPSSSQNTHQCNEMLVVKIEQQYFCGRTLLATLLEIACVSATLTKINNSSDQTSPWLAKDSILVTINRTLRTKIHREKLWYKTGGGGLGGWCQGMGGRYLRVQGGVAIICHVKFSNYFYEHIFDNFNQKRYQKTFKRCQNHN